MELDVGNMICLIESIMTYEKRNNNEVTNKEILDFLYNKLISIPSKSLEKITTTTSSKSSDNELFALNDQQLLNRLKIIDLNKQNIKSLRVLTKNQKEIKICKIMQQLTNEIFQCDPYNLKIFKTLRNTYLRPDCFSAKLSIVIEYNGPLHYDRHCGTVTRRDIEKREICNRNKLSLIVVSQIIAESQFQHYLYFRLLTLSQKEIKVNYPTKLLKRQYSWSEVNLKLALVDAIIKSIILERSIATIVDVKSFSQLSSSTPSSLPLWLHNDDEYLKFYNITFSSLVNITTVVNNNFKLVDEKKNVISLEDYNSPNIDRFICYASNCFFPIHDNGRVGYSDCWSDAAPGGKNQIKKILSLKKAKKSKVKAIMMSIGGWTYSGNNYGKIFPVCNDQWGGDAIYTNKRTFANIWHEILINSTYQNIFISSILDMIKLHPFDGVEIDYEYPTCPQGECLQNLNIENKMYIRFIHNLHSKLKTINKITSIAVAGGIKNIQNLSLRCIIPYVEFINVMTYDYFGYGYSNGIVRHNQPKDEIINTLKYIINDKLVNAEKINIGIALYGRGYQISQQDFIKISKENQRPSSGFNVIGPSTQFDIAYEPSLITHADICFLNICRNQREINDENINCVYSIFDTDENSSYLMFNNDNIISYTDIKDLKQIVEIMKQMNIRGVLIYSADQDDYTAKCNYTSSFSPAGYSIIRSLKYIDEMKNENFIIEKDSTNNGDTSTPHTNDDSTTTTTTTTTFIPTTWLPPITTTTTTTMPNINQCKEPRYLVCVEKM
ncbi:hypothetical protein PV326_004883 [Microctonus aethiopoides]|nr:hypothetical protein PV326_004883 [Microctonus aethiopoides]